MRTGILGFVRLDTSFGEASSRTQATDPNRRETLRIRTPLPGLRGEAKWLRKRLCFRNRVALRRGVPKLLRERWDWPRFHAAARQCLSAGVVCVWRAGGASRTKGGVRWTLIVRAEVGPSRRYPCQLLAHADPPAFPG